MTVTENNVAAQAGDEPQPDDIIPIRLPSGGKAIVRLPRPFTLADGVHLMNFLSEYIEEKNNGK
jgi:hypothetical protein